MKQTIQILFIFVLTFAGTCYSLAQESCTQKLEDARELFNKGQIDEVPLLLEGCLQKGFTKAEKVDAYRLLTLCHLYYNRSAEAAESMRLMLKYNPEYKIQDIDPSEFQTLHNSFRTLPVMIIGFKGGIGYLRPTNIQNYNDFNSFSNKITYTPGIASNIGISMEIPILKELSISPEIYYSTYNYSSNRDLLDYTNISFDESVSCIEMPIMIQYNILKDQKAIPYIALGANLSYMLKSTGNFVREDKDTISGSSRGKETSGIDFIESRNQFNYGLTGGAGVRIKDILGKGYLTFDIRYSHCFINHVDASDRVEDTEATYLYLHTDNSFNASKLQFFLGYKIPLYKPKQKKKNKIE